MREGGRKLPESSIAGSTFWMSHEVIIYRLRWQFATSTTIYKLRQNFHTFEPLALQPAVLDTQWSSTMNKVEVLVPGYSFAMEKDTVIRACGTSTLVTADGLNILVDTLGPWDSKQLVEALQERGLTPEDINIVIGTHGHPDHVGNLNLFTNAKLHFVGHSIYQDDRYQEHPFRDGVAYQISQSVQIIPTPGHTASCISLMVKNVSKFGTVAIVGDLFENENDLLDDKIWLNAGSEDPKQQRISRAKILSTARFIIPGHGNIFQVPNNWQLFRWQSTVSIPVFGIVIDTLNDDDDGSIYLLINIIF